MINLEQKKVLLTGASGGIGKAIAIELASLGADICLTGRNEEELIKLKNELGGNSDYVLTDLSNHDEIDGLVKEAEDKLGQIDILVNNAGITDDNLFLRMSDDQWNNVINVNLSSTFKITKAAVKGMVKRRYGRIINISSVIGVLGGAGQANYSASKAAIIGMSKSLAQELGSRSITVNCIAPGFIETNMTSELNDSRRDEILKSIVLKRLGLPNDISGAVSYLASDSAGYITGQTLHINGGMLMV
jgi:3-oxoacyl-[acyl-carrier protein] reductase